MINSSENSSSGLHQALLHDDDLVAVVRSHLHMEVQVNRLIESLMPFPKEIEKSRFNWKQRVELALGLGLKTQYGPPLKKLGNVRNKFAHDPSASLADKDVSELFQCLYKEDHDIVLESFKLTQLQATEPLESTFLGLSAKDRFTFIVVTLHSMLQVAISEVTGAPIST